MKKVSIILLVTLASAINAAEKPTEKPTNPLIRSTKSLYSQEAMEALKRLQEKNANEEKEKGNK
jgi:hypothetical protein